MTPQEMNAQEDARMCKLTGRERVDQVQYMQRAIMGQFGPVSQAGVDSIKRTLRMMGEVA